jgi:hypothetical protein
VKQNINIFCESERHSKSDVLCHGPQLACGAGAEGVNFCFEEEDRERSRMR